MLFMSSSDLDTLVNHAVIETPQHCHDPCFDLQFHSSITGPAAKLPLPSPRVI